MSIILLGDSLSKGIVYDASRDRFTLTKQSFFNRIAPLLKLPVINLSRLGCTLGDALKTLKSSLEREQPDAVVIELGGNDCDLDWAAVAKEPEGTHSAKTPLEDFEKGLLTTVEELKTRGIQPVLMNLPPIDAQRYFKRVCCGSEEMERGVLKYLGEVGRIYWWHERYSAAIGEVSQSTSTPLIDIRRAFLHEEDYRKYICEDGIHPNEAGHALIAQRVSEFLHRHYSKWLTV